MVDENTAIRVSGVTKQLGGRVVFRDVCLEIERGEIVALTGANGAGKTTLLRCLSTALRPSCGEIRWLQQPAGGGAALRQLIGFAAHESYLYPHLTAAENLLFAARMYRLQAPEQRVQQQLDSAGLTHLRHVLAGRLSQGMRRRFSLLRATVHRPPIVLLDEPFSGIDEAGKAWLIDQLAGLSSEGHCVCFVTHDLSMVQRLADRVFHLKSGRLHEVAANCDPDQRMEPTATRAA